MRRENNGCVKERRNGKKTRPRGMEVRGGSVGGTSAINKW